MTIAEPRLAVDEIQGDIVPGFKNDHQTFVFYRIVEIERARGFFQALAPHLSSAAEVKRGNRRFSRLRRELGHDPPDVRLAWLNVALSATGLRKLTRPEDVEQFEDAHFKGGMAADAASLGDPAGSVDGWQVGGTQHPVDAVVILADDDAAALARREEVLDRCAGASGLVRVAAERGDVLSGALAGCEHFGFKDGISQPSIRGTEPPEDAYFTPRTIPDEPALAAYAADFAAPGSALVWPGHFLFGYGKQADADPRVVNPDKQPIGPAWAANGSFLVFRRLRQDVPAFEAFVTRTAAELTASHPGTPFSPAWVAACLVGRWRSGTPLMRSPRADLAMAADATNYFRFDEAAPGPLPGDPGPLAGVDGGGDVCPVAAHIRKVNPRDGTTDLGGAGRTVPRLILRRGISYGPPFEAGDPASAARDRGLLFVCFQSSIHDQFSFLTRRWANQDDRPMHEGVTGHDAIIGATSGTRTFTFAVADPPERKDLPAPWVVATGGEYLFAPSIRFFRETLATFAPRGA